MLTFSFEGNDKYTGACRQKKCGRQSLALPDASHIQEIAHPDHASYSVTRERGCTVDITHSQLHRREVTRGREREAVQTYTFAIFSRIPSLTYQDDRWQRTRLLRPLHAFWSIFSIVCLPRPWLAKCFRLTVVLPAYCIAELSRNKAFDKKERKKERKKNNSVFSTSSGFEL